MSALLLGVQIVHIIDLYVLDVVQLGVHSC